MTSSQLWTLVLVTNLFVCSRAHAQETTGSSPATPATPEGSDSHTAQGGAVQVSEPETQDAPVSPPAPSASEAQAQASGDAAASTAATSAPGESEAAEAAPPAARPPLDLELPRATPSEIKTIFSRNSFSLGGRFGWASTTEQTWGLVGAGLGYSLFDGVEVRADVDFWLGSPHILVVTPAARYVFYWLPDVKPYIGPLYRRYVPLEGGVGSDALGARAGVIFMLSAAVYVQGGVLYEHLLDQNLFEKSDAVYPEIGIAFGF